MILVMEQPEVNTLPCLDCQSYLDCQKHYKRWIQETNSRVRTRQLIQDTCRKLSMYIPSNWDKRRIKKIKESHNYIK